MEKQLYIVENVLPREKRARKSLVCRWVVIASSPEEAIELAVEASVREVLDEPIDAEDLIEEKTFRLFTWYLRKCGEWQATAEGQVSRLSNRSTWH